MLEGSTADPGILPRALNELFALRRRLGLAMSCCMFEVCGDTIHDLVTPAALSAAGIRADCVRSSTLERQPVREVLLYHRHHTFSLLHHAMALRKHNKTGQERGHFVTVVRVERPNVGKRGLLYLVDLCGMSELSDDRGESSASVKDTVSTNSDVVRGCCGAHIMSLLSSGCVVNGRPVSWHALSLVQSQHHFERMVMSRASGGTFIPSKSCLLTRVLVDACGGNSKTALLVFLSPRLEDKKVTLHAIQFAQSARSIRNLSQQNSISLSDLTSLRAAFSVLGSPASTPSRALDDSGAFPLTVDADAPKRVRNWMNLKPYVPIAGSPTCVCTLR